MQIGACGDHCGDPYSLEFLEANQVDYITCMPARVAVAKVAAAQAHIQITAGMLFILNHMNTLLTDYYK